MSFRYSAAWAEVNSRLQSRQLVNVHFAVAVLTLTSVLLGLAERDAPQQWVIVLSTALVLLAWTFTLWIRHNDAIIGLLGAFCTACERLSDKDNTKGLPAWHGDEQGWIIVARHYREFSDRAGMILAALASIPALVVGYYQLLMPNPPLGLCFLLVGVAGLGAAWFLYRNKGLRTRIAHGEFKEVNGKWKFVLPPTH